MRVKQPCTPDCEKRSATCHSECEAWLKYEKERNDEYEKRLERKTATMRTYIKSTRFKK